MKIILNLLAVSTGGQITRANAFLSRFKSLAPDAKLVILKREDIMPDLISVKNIKIVNVFISRGALSSLHRMFWENTKMPSLLQALAGDIYLSFSHYLPFRRLSMPTVIAVSNLAPFFPTAIAKERLFGKSRLLLLRRTIIHSAKKAQRVIALSSTCEKILVSYNVPSNKITVIPNGVDSVYKINSKLEIKEHPYILSVSHFYRYKNIEQLLNAYSLSDGNIRRNHRLILVGKFYDKKYVEELIMQTERLGISSDVDFIPGLETAKLNNYYSKARLFVFTSLIENSPNILLEAMSHGLPIISTDNDPMPEFGGAAIEYVKAGDDLGLKKKIEHFLTNQSHIKEYAARSKVRATLFSWDKFARGVLQLCYLESKAVGRGQKKNKT